MHTLQAQIDKIIESKWRHYISDDEHFFDFGGNKPLIPDGTLVSDIILCFQVRYPNSYIKWSDSYNSKSGILVKYITK